MSDIHIMVRDPALNWIGEVAPMTFTAVLRFNAVSNWTMQVARSQGLADILAQGNGYGIQVLDGTRTLLSGFVDHKEARWSTGEDALYLSGPDDTTLLRDRVARPVPTGPPYTAAAYDVRTGDAGTVLRDYVKYHVQDSTVPTERRVSNLTLPSPPTTGITGTWRARWQVLLDLLAEIATAGGLGFSITQAALNFALNIYVPQDKSATALFSGPLRNLVSYGYVKNAPDAVHVLALGAGDLTARVTAEATDSTALAETGRYIETPYNRTDISNTTELAQAVTTQLATLAEKRSLTLEPIDTPRLQFGVDYNLGDVVAVRVEQTTLNDVVREVTWSLTRDQGLRVVPTIGTSGASGEGAGDVPDLFAATDAQLRELTKRVLQLERAS